jgi:hypothetical protein
MDYTDDFTYADAGLLVAVVCIGAIALIGVLCLRAALADRLMFRRYRAIRLKGLMDGWMVGGGGPQRA